MADTIKISQMDPASALTGTEFIPIVQTGLNVRTNPDDVLTFVESEIEISESQVTNLVADLANKQPLDSVLTSIADLTTDGAIVKTGSTVDTQEILSTNGTPAGGSSNIVGRDSNGNAAINNIVFDMDFRNALGTPIALNANSGRIQQFDFGSVATDILMPDATTLIPAWTFKILNMSTAVVTVKTNVGGTICTLPIGASAIAVCLTTTTAGGTWEFFVDSTQNLTSGSVLFSTTGGFTTQDNTNFNYNDSTNQLSVTNCSVGNTVASPTNGLYVEGSIKNNALTASQLVVTDASKNLVSQALATGSLGGTGVNNGSNTATFAGNLNFANSFTTSGNFSVTQTYTGVTNVTFPTSGTLATTAQLPTPAALTRVDDTNVTLTLGGTPSTALLQATSITAGWTGQLGVTRGGTGLGSTTANQLLYSSSNNVIAGLATGNNGVVITSGAGVPSVSSTLPTAVQGNITSTGTLGSLTVTGNINNTALTASQVVITDSSKNLTSAASSIVGTWVLIQSQTAAVSSSIDFTTGLGAYSLLKFVYVDVRAVIASNVVLQITVSNNGGSSYITTNYKAGLQVFSFNSATPSNSNSTSAIPISGNYTTTLGEFGSGQIYISKLANLNFNVWGDSLLFASTAPFREFCQGTNTANSGCNAVRFAFTGGALIGQGTFSVYGLVQ
jgi:hypothetical protein